MELAKAMEHYGKNVRVACVDGDVVIGLLGNCKTFADEPEKPESISIYIDDFAIEIPIAEISSIALL